MNLARPLYAIACWVVISLCPIVRPAVADDLKGAELAESKLGKAEAERDIKRGVIKYVIAGEGRWTDAALKATAMKKYHIDVVFPGCKVGPRFSYDRGYHEAVVDYLEKKYGRDPVALINQELQSASEPAVDSGGVVEASLCFAAPLITRKYPLEPEVRKKLLEQITSDGSSPAVVDLAGYFRSKGAELPPGAKATFTPSDSVITVTVPSPISISWSSR